MLPNWLYGKSKSKLTSILGGGTPADYDQVKAQVTQNAEDILLLSDALDGKAALTQISNPNLLDNPWFTINQRAATTLTSGGKLADRWSITGNGTWEATIASDGLVTIDNSDNDNTLYFIQKMPADFFAKVGSKPLTASLMFNDGTIVHGSKVDSTGTVYYSDDNIAITRNYQSEVININIKAGATVSIRAVKLEVGSISTLAMDVAPSYETELLKCQRYFERFIIPTGGMIAIGFAQWTEGIRFSLPIKEKASMPSITVTSQATQIGYTKAGAAAATAIASLSIAYYEMNQIVMQAITSGLTAGDVFAMINMANDTMFIDFSAEL